ncbi:histidine kinase dimerization/phosphoacceptor domain -containing protein [Fulvimarina sp. 2208YS6-2-32]|uniref:Histidine kinase dimerization/phosphoacceptor domain -containing protein n=1 Tax=Fulvimarina uroteuthidis TaxID=3098149 RepID=A0ABU5I016_9HYPH|nr:histidine kinase dimerization/phosphoacceptor domain -containing protein [Fulvimarina sp. 2208YS6-2-32]MDY8108159.1 histidine kinase dimerization/phosphoacceptor domain -containing protein [Fulvimarina sp. 2208YS6-2-32]
MEDIDAFRLTDALDAEQGTGDPFAAAVRSTRMPMIVTDPRKSDNPIVFANDAFIRLSGYSRDECMGVNCRFLQGPDTDPAAIDRLREAVAARTDVSVEILNYRKDGSTFWNALYMSPVFGHDGDLQFFFASQLDVTEIKDRELKAHEDRAFFEAAVKERTVELEQALEQQKMLLHEVDHRVKNNLQMVSAMIRNQARVSDSADVKAALSQTLSRVDTLGVVHRRLYEAEDISQFDLADFIRDLATSLLDTSSRPEISLDLDLQSIETSAQNASPIALLVNELLTNALKHAFPDPSQGGTIRIASRQDASGFSVVIEDDGVGLPDRGEADAAPAPKKPTFGTKLVRSLARQLRAQFIQEPAHPGTRSTIRIDADKTRMTE